MHMIRHDDRHAQIVCLLMIMPATIEHDLTCPIRQDAAILRNKRDEMWLVVALQVRKIAAIKGHERIVARDAVVRLEIEREKLCGCPDLEISITTRVGAGARPGPSSGAVFAGWGGHPPTAERSSATFI